MFFDLYILIILIPFFLKQFHHINLFHFISSSFNSSKSFDLPAIFECFFLRSYLALYFSNISNGSDDYRIPPLSLLSQIHKIITIINEMILNTINHISTQ